MYEWIWTLPTDMEFPLKVKEEYFFLIGVITLHG